MKLPKGVNKPVLKDVCIVAARMAVEKSEDCAVMPKQMLLFHYELLFEAAIVTYLERTRGADVPNPPEN